MYMTSTQPDFISNSLEPWMIKERENILPSITASVRCPMQRRIKPTSERENPNVTMNENKEPRIKVPSREKKKKEWKKEWIKFSTPFQESSCSFRLSTFLFLDSIIFSFSSLGSVGSPPTQFQLKEGGRWFRDSRVINAILRLVSFLLRRLIDHTRPFLTYNRVPRQVRPPNSGISSDVDERSRISSSPFLHSFFLFSFLLFPPSLIEYRYLAI